MAVLCGRCKHYAPKGYPAGTGACKRYPPVNHGYQTFEFDGNTDVRAWRRPVTRQTDTCGEGEAP